LFVAFFEIGGATTTCSTINWLTRKAGPQAATKRYVDGRRSSRYKTTLFTGAASDFTAATTVNTAASPDFTV
jgi:hypothetical protein